MAKHSGRMALFGFMAFEKHCPKDAYFKRFLIRYSISSFRDGGKILVPVSITFREG